VIGSTTCPFCGGGSLEPLNVREKGALFYCIMCRSCGPVDLSAPAWKKPSAPGIHKFTETRKDQNVRLLRENPREVGHLRPGNIIYTQGHLEEVTEIVTDRDLAPAVICTGHRVLLHEIDQVFTP